MERGQAMKKTDDKERKLSKAEQKRVEEFEITKSELIEQGYEMKEHTLGLLYANIMAAVVSFPFFLPVIAAFVIFRSDKPLWFIMSSGELALFILFNILLIVAHEAVHGITWSFFTENGFKSISFGIMPELCTPYCNCSEPLKRNQYILGSLMPLFVVGILPSVIAIITGWFWLLLVGVCMILGAGGDIIITYRILKYKSDRAEVIYYDHPTKCGFITFER
jgi:hypothetical protein